MSKPLLSSFAANTYSQFGEDGMLKHLLEKVGVKYKTCAEFGAWDGVYLSNTASLWRDQGWKSIQVESEDTRFAALQENTKGYAVIPIHASIWPDNINHYLSALGPLDVLSIDVDGADYILFEALEIRPRIIIIEFNQSIPPHLDIRQPTISNNFSSSGLATKRLAESKGYKLAGRSESNLFFVEGSEYWPVNFYETDWDKLFSWNEFTYMVADMVGNITSVGHGPQWGYATSPIKYPLTTQGSQPMWRKYVES